MAAATSQRKARVSEGQPRLTVLASARLTNMDRLLLRTHFIMLLERDPENLVRTTDGECAPASTLISLSGAISRNRVSHA